MASGDTLALFGALHSDSGALTSAFATLGLRNGHAILQFDTTTQWSSFFSGKMPQHYAGGNLVVYIAWTAATATTGTIGWDVTFERLNDAGQDIDADGFATAQTVTAATVDGTSGNLKTTNVVCTAGSTGTDSIAAGDPFRVRVRRDVANDTAAGNAEISWVEIREA